MPLASDLPAALLNGVGVVGLLALLFWLLATGRLVTRREHDGRIRDKDGQLGEAKEAARILSRQVDDMLKNDELTHALLKSLIGVKESHE